VCKIKFLCQKVNVIHFIFMCRSVEDVNQEVSENYHLKFLQHMACMEDGLNRFTEDLVRFCSGLQTNLGMFIIQSAQMFLAECKRCLSAWL
jgi:hypothetical protein